MANKERWVIVMADSLTFSRSDLTSIDHRPSV